MLSGRGGARTIARAAAALAVLLGSLGAAFLWPGSDPAFLAALIGAALFGALSHNPLGVPLVLLLALPAVVAGAVQDGDTAHADLLLLDLIPLGMLLVIAAIGWLAGLGVRRARRAAHSAGQPA